MRVWLVAKNCLAPQTLFYFSISWSFIEQTPIGAVWLLVTIIIYNLMANLLHLSDSFFYFLLINSFYFSGALAELHHYCGWSWDWNKWTKGTKKIKRETLRTKSEWVKSILVWKDCSAKNSTSYRPKRKNNLIRMIWRLVLAFFILFPGKTS